MAKNNKLPVLVDMKAALSDFGEYYKQSVKQIVLDERERHERLRVSSFPYCGLRHAYQRMTKHEKPAEADFGSHYYTSVGTVAHDIIQNFMGRKGQIYGAWVCPKRNCKGKRAFSRKNTCPICKGRMQYVELTVKAFKNVSGHLDGIWRNEHGHYFLVDYKTSSVNVITTQRQKPTLPYFHNVCQIKAYCALIELMFEIEISGWILMYVARDNPMMFSKPVGELITAKQKAKELKKIKRYDKEWSRVTNLTSLEELHGVIKRKPCGDYDEYREKFDPIDPCILATSGVCFNRGRLRETMEIVWHDRPKEFRLG